MSGGDHWIESFFSCDFEDDFGLGCRSLTDFRCCVCSKKVCHQHSSCCSQCAEVACLKCIWEDLCCLEKRGRSREIFYEFYKENSFVHPKLFQMMNLLCSDGNYYSSPLVLLRLEILKRSILRIFQTEAVPWHFLTKLGHTGSYIFAKSFPKIQEFLKIGDEKRFKKFLSNLGNLRSCYESHSFP